MPPSLATSLWPSRLFQLIAAFVLQISVQTGKLSYHFCDCRSICLNQLSLDTALVACRCLLLERDVVPRDGDVSGCSSVVGWVHQGPSNHTPAPSTCGGEVLPAWPWRNIFSPAAPRKPNCRAARSWGGPAALPSLPLSPIMHLCLLRIT